MLRSELAARLKGGVTPELLEIGEPIVPLLVEILLDDELAMAGAIGDGFAPVHATRLLAELRAEVAIEPMLRRLVETNWSDILHDALITSLPKLGAAVVEPALRAYTAATDPEIRSSIASVLAEVGVREDRILAVLLETFALDANHAGLLAAYGDPRALEQLSRAFDNYQIVGATSPLADQALIEIRATIEGLGGALTVQQEAKLGVAMEARDRWRRAIHSHVPAIRGERPGRNEPCWCGSSKKYKKCHLDADDLDGRTTLSV